MHILCPGHSFVNGVNVVIIKRTVTMTQGSKSRSPKESNNLYSRLSDSKLASLPGPQVGLFIGPYYSLRS